jgi:hypothetical protein
VELGLDRGRPDRVQDPPFDRLAEHDVAWPDGKAGPDESADQVADPVVARVLPSLFMRLVDASEDDSDRRGQDRRDPG